MSSKLDRPFAALKHSGMMKRFRSHSRQEVVKTVGVGESRRGGRQLSGRKPNNTATKSQALEAENLAVITGVC